MFKEVILFATGLFLILYFLFAFREWVLLLGVVIVLVMGIAVYYIFQEDWDKRFGLHGSEDGHT